jgi:predicted phage baseplate assembly protein
VSEAWVTWQNRQFLYDSGANDRYYTLERARGRVTFGDGNFGKIPPLGAAIRAKQYRTGGGLVGNLDSRTITQVLSAIPGVEAVFNPKPSEGGADAETLENLSLRGPQTLRHRGQAIAIQDYETMAKEASPSVAVARAIPTTDASDRYRPGWVTLVIIPHSEAPRPIPSFGLREQVRKYIEARAAADLVAAQHIQVIAPDYLPVDVEVTIVPIDAAEAGAVETRVRSALNRFLHPLRGSPEGRGWQPGRDVFLSDVAAVIERVEGVDYAKELSLLLGGVLQAEQISIAANRTVVAGEIRIRLELN